MTELLNLTDEAIADKIILIRGKKVMLDRDLAEMYSVETRVLNQAVKRNQKRFPADFMFQLTAEEVDNWTSQIVISNKEKMGLRKRPYAFTEQGVAMLSSVLKSETAIAVNILIIRVFTRMRAYLLDQKELLLKLDGLEKELVKQNEKRHKHEEDIQTIFRVLRQLLATPKKERQQIGFKPSAKNESTEAKTKLIPHR